MDKESVERLRFDRRLRRRPGWIEKADQDAFLETLPDVTEKMTTCAEEAKIAEEVAAEESVAAPSAVAAPYSAPTLAPTSAPQSVPTLEDRPSDGPAGTPAPTAGDFSTPSPFGNPKRESGEN